MTKEQIQGIQKDRGTTNFTVNFILDYEKQWNEVVGRLKNSKVDLAKINLVEKLDKG